LGGGGTDEREWIQKVLALQTEQSDHVPNVLLQEGEELQEVRKVSE
jgi:hypothetical protein